MKIRKKLLYYILSAVTLAFICSFGILFGDGETFVSVISAVITLPGAELSDYSMFHAFGSGMTGTIDMLLPVCCAIPSASYIYDEIKSGMISYVQMRKGKYRYIYSIYAYSAVSGAASVLAGLAVYMIFTAFFFPFETAMEPATVFGIVTEMGLLILNKMMYGAAMAVCASFLICIYTNLYFVLSFLFIIAYVARDIFYVSNIMYFIITLIIMAVLYGVMWRYRGERI